MNACPSKESNSGCATMPPPRSGRTGPTPSPGTHLTNSKPSSAEVAPRPHRLVISDHAFSQLLDLRDAILVASGSQETADGYMRALHAYAGLPRARTSTARYPSRPTCSWIPQYSHHRIRSLPGSAGCHVHRLLPTRASFNRTPPIFEARRSRMTKGRPLRSWV